MPQEALRRFAVDAKAWAVRIRAQNGWGTKMYIYTLEHPTDEDHVIVLDHPIPDSVRRAYEVLGYVVGNQRVH